MTPAVAERLAERAILAVDLPSPIGSTALISGVLLLCGWSVRESAGGAPAVFELYDGQDGGGQLVATVSVPSGDSKAQGPAVAGVGVEGGLYFKLISGKCSGVVWIRTLGT